MSVLLPRQQHLRNCPRARRGWLAFAASAVLSAAVTPLPVQGCGGGYDDPTIINSKDPLLTMPSAKFVQELSRIKLPATPFKYLPPLKTNFDSNDAADRTDLDAYLQAAGVPAGDRDALRESVSQVRLDVSGYADRHATWNAISPKSSAVVEPQRPAVVIDPKLPPEFRDYLSGWVAFEFQEPRNARTHWQQILNLPADQQHYRGAWAAYMTGRSLQTQDNPDSAGAIDWFVKTRELVTAGGKDTLGLASASYGWQARAELDLKHFDRAIDLYLLQLATGDQSAVQSLQLTVAAALGSDVKTLAALAGNAAARDVITAYVTANGGPWQKAPKADTVRTWLDAIEQAKIPNVPGAERFAWSAYEYGHYDLAARWVAKTDSKNGLGLWIASKLALRDGRVDEAMKLLANASTSFPPSLPTSGMNKDDEYRPYPDTSQRVRGELGALQLGRANYVDSLDLLLNSGYWIDAAYIAERVLTADELRAYVDHSTKAVAPAESDSGRLRALLARRLLRLGRWKDARPYFAAGEQKELDAYIAAIRAGHDDKLTAGDRATSLWKAAQIARNSGMELLGTELGPGAKIFGGGGNEENYINADRIKVTYAPLKASADELERLKRPPEQLEKRFQYRYVASEHAWAAAQLMLDDTDELADVLNRAGTWLKSRDPLAADRFYKALCHRCPNTATGKKAIALKWFPPV